MAIKRVDRTFVENGITIYVGTLEYQGLSTDTKPTLAESQLTLQQNFQVLSY